MKSNFITSTVFISSFLIFIFCAGVAFSSDVLLAGASSVNITPPLGLPIIGNWNSPPATHVHDDLHAKCLILDDSSVKQVFIVTELLGIKADLAAAAKSIIEDETGIPSENIMISAVHTHSAASAMGDDQKRRRWAEGEPFDEYQNFVIRRIADAVRIALNNLEPAEIGWGSGFVPQHVFVRRWIMKEPVVNPIGEMDRVVMNPGRLNPNLVEPSSKPDPEVFFLSVRSIKGHQIALLANYSLHYVGGVPSGHISADYFAVFAKNIEKLLEAENQEPPFVGIMSNGTSGDVNNINFAAQADNKKPYEQMQLVADDVAQEVYRVYKTIEHRQNVKLSVITEKLPLKSRKPDEKLLARSVDVLNRPDNVKPVHVHEKTYAGRILNLNNWPDTINIVLQAFRIGDLGIATVPFEVFSETGLRIKSASPLKSTFTIELANGYYGYLPTPGQHKLGGYETWPGTCNVEQDASEKITAKLLEMLGK